MRETLQLKEAHTLSVSTARVQHVPACLHVQMCSMLHQFHHWLSVLLCELAALFGTEAQTRASLHVDDTGEVNQVVHVPRKEWHPKHNMQTSRLLHNLLSIHTVDK